MLSRAYNERTPMVYLLMETSLVQPQVREDVVARLFAAHFRLHNLLEQAFTVTRMKLLSSPQMVNLRTVNSTRKLWQELSMLQKKW